MKVLLLTGAELLRENRNVTKLVGEALCTKIPFLLSVLSKQGQMTSDAILTHLSSDTAVDITATVQERRASTF